MNRRLTITRLPGYCSKAGEAPRKGRFLGRNIVEDNGVGEDGSFMKEKQEKVPSVTVVTRNCRSRFHRTFYPLRVGPSLCTRTGRGGSCQSPG